MIAVQCWDDGVSDDIRLIEILRKHGAKASFNLNFGSHTAKRTSGWKYKEKQVWKLAKGELRDVYTGFLVANHTLTHPSLPDLPLEKALEEVKEGRDQLEQWFGYPVRGFAYPFGHHNEAVEKIVRDTGHLYARTCDNAAQVLPASNAMSFASSCHFADPEFWSKFESVKDADGVFYFWGHSYELISEEDWQNFEDKISRLSREARWKDLPELFA
jgi:peptidoglycan/xylan/chitin deacetylase (PgdA/CDA1 family)